LKIRPAVARAFLRLSGWAREGELPAARAYVLIAAPHTTNWVLLYFLALAWAFGISPSWMGKRSLFRGPLGPVMRALGGIPVDRARAGGLVAQM
jgi:1-acyl-sn-glycerol-3-phosphate acyltransferase